MLWKKIRDPFSAAHGEVCAVGTEEGRHPHTWTIVVLHREKNGRREHKLSVRHDRQFRSGFLWEQKRWVSSDALRSTFENLLARVERDAALTRVENDPTGGRTP